MCDTSCATDSRRFSIHNPLPTFNMREFRKEQDDKRSSFAFQVASESKFFLFSSTLGPCPVESHRFDGAALAGSRQLAELSASNGHGSRRHVVTCSALFASLSLSSKKNFFRKCFELIYFHFQSRQVAQCPNTANTVTITTIRTLILRSCTTHRSLKSLHSQHRRTITARISARPSPPACIWPTRHLKPMLATRVTRWSTTWCTIR